jgi:hypothetical protein
MSFDLLAKPPPVQTTSFGGSSAIVTGVGLIVGLGAAHVNHEAIVAALLIFGFADNLTDSLSIHIYQEAERLEERAALRATVGNYLTRVLITLGFVALVLLLPAAYAMWASAGCGAGLLIALTWLVAVRRGASPLAEIWRHVGVAALVIAASSAIGALVTAYVR